MNMQRRIAYMAEGRNKALIPADADILPVTDDGVFKSLFSKETPESKAALTDLISAIIGRRVKDVTVVTSEPPKDNQQQKAIRMDVSCVAVDNGEQFDLEMQMEPMKEDRQQKGEYRNLKNRKVYYGSRLFSGQNAKGNRYDQLVRSYQITFCDFVVYAKDKRYIRNFLPRDEEGEILSDILSFVLIELPKMRELMAKPVSELKEI